MRRQGRGGLEAKNVIAIVDKEAVENLIYIVRGQKVMLDVDLARIYGYETRRFNEQVKNNSERFDDDFRFQLTKPEFENFHMLLQKLVFICL